MVVALVNTVHLYSEKVYHLGKLKDGAYVGWQVISLVFSHRIPDTNQNYRVLINTSRLISYFARPGTGTGPGAGSGPSIHTFGENSYGLLTLHGNGTGTGTGRGLVQKGTMGPGSCLCLWSMWPFLHGTILSVPVPVKFPCSVNTNSRTVWIHHNIGPRQE